MAEISAMRRTRVDFGSESTKVASDYSVRTAVSLRSWECIERAAKPPGWRSTFERKFYAYGGVPLGPLPGLGCCAHGQLGGCVPVAGWLFHESSSGGVLVQSLLIAAAGC